MQNKRKKIYKLIYSALFAALVSVSTMIIRIPILTNGYVHLGDGCVLLAGFILNCYYGPIAAGIGSAFADIFAGYAVYVPATFIIKAVVALIANRIFTVFSKGKESSRVRRFWGITIGGICAELFMTISYFLFEAIILGYGLGAVVGIVGNIVQGSVGIVSSLIFMAVIDRIRFNSKFIER